MSKVEIINNNNEVVAVMREGEFFGEMGLVFSIPRYSALRNILTHFLVQRLCVLSQMLCVTVSAKKVRPQKLLVNS